MTKDELTSKILRLAEEATEDFPNSASMLYAVAGSILHSSAVEAVMAAAIRNELKRYLPLKEEISKGVPQNV